MKSSKNALLCKTEHNKNNSLKNSELAKLLKISGFQETNGKDGLTITRLTAGGAQFSTSLIAIAVSR